MKKWIFILFLVVGVSLLLASGVGFVHSRQFLQTAVSAEGEVLSLIPRSSTDSRGMSNGVTYAPEVLFQATDGQEITFQSTNSTNPPSYSPGQKITVLYEKENPTNARIEGFSSNYLGSLIAGILGLMFTAFGLGPLWYVARRKRIAIQLKAHGQKIVGAVSSVEKDGAMSINGKNPYRIYASGGPALGTAGTIFKSDFIWFDPTQWALPGHPIDIYIDPQNSKRYFVDTSFLPTVK